MNVKRVTERIEVEEDSAYSLDAGLIWGTPDAFAVSIVVKNIIPTKLKLIKEGYPLGRSVNLGIAHTIKDKGKFALEWYKKPRGNSLNVGVELNFAEFISLRGGFDSYLGKNSKLGFPAGITWGIGLKLLEKDYLHLNLDYAYLPYGYLSGTHIISLTCQ
jgi:hypothetical protein